MPHQLYMHSRNLDIKYGSCTNIEKPFVHDLFEHVLSIRIDALKKLTKCWKSTIQSINKEIVLSGLVTVDAREDAVSRLRSYMVNTTKYRNAGKWTERRDISDSLKKQTFDRFANNPCYCLMCVCNYNMLNFIAQKVSILQRTIDKKY